MQIKKGAIEATIPAIGLAGVLNVALVWAAPGPMSPPGPPIDYGQWSVAGGTVNDTACSDPDVLCTPIAEDDGFRYELIATPNGQFTRTIMTDPGGVSGDETSLEFSSETYTPLLSRPSSSGASALPDGSLAQGLAARQIVRDAAGTMESLTEIQRGFARAVPSFGGVSSSGQLGEPLSDQAWSTMIQQRILDTSVEGTITQGTSILTYTDLPSAPTGPPETNHVRGQLVDVWQELTDSDTGAIQKFDHRMRSGDTGWAFFCFDPYVPCPPSVTNGGTVNMTNGSSVTWAAGDAITGTWIADDIGVFSLTEVSSPGNGTARSVGASNTTPNGWQSAAADDLNWPLYPNVSDPFASPVPPLQIVLPANAERTSAPD